VQQSPQLPKLKGNVQGLILHCTLEVIGWREFLNAKKQTISVLGLWFDFPVSV
jgi:hypothetical protein